MVSKIILDFFPYKLMIKSIFSRGLQILAIYFLLKAGYQTIGNISLIQSATRTQGKIVSSYKEFDYSTQTRGKSYGTSYYIDRPIIQYTIKGVNYELHGQIRGKIGSSYQLGQTVPIYYLPDNPDFSMIDSFYEMWYEPIRTFIFSLLIFAFRTFLFRWIERVKE